MDHLIPTGSPDLVLVSREKKLSSSRLLKNRKITMEYYDDGDTNRSRSPWNNPKEPGKETGGTGDPGKDWNRPDHSIVHTSHFTSISRQWCWLWQKDRKKLENTCSIKTGLFIQIIPLIGRYIVFRKYISILHFIYLFKSATVIWYWVD